MFRTSFRRPAALAAWCLMAIGSPLAAQDQPTRTGLFTGALAGQVVATLPLTALTQDGTVQLAPAGDRQAALAWADSLLGETLVTLAPEVNWTLPPDLRRMARRSGGILTDPDRMGQAVMRSPRLKTVPDPLRASLRTLSALAGGRFVFIPASLDFGRDEDGAVRATLVAVLADARTGQVVWRTVAVGAGATADGALKAAIEGFLPRTDRLQ